MTAVRVVVAMSGGVDSSVAAALLAERGYEVIGVSMQLYDQTEGQSTFGSCCSLDDLADARRVAAVIGIPHYVVNFERQFGEHVVSNFVQEYLAGRTPIPCVRCNSSLKFATLLERARALGADRVATGHFARVERDEPMGRYRLRRGVDEEKDQSYFLFSLTQAQLAGAVFPVGALRKDQVREIAARRGLPVARKPESQEICFVPDHDYAGFIEHQTGGSRPAPGAILDTRGRRLGTHAGIHRFTVGQRRGLGVAASHRLYVLKVRPDDNAVVVGRAKDLQRDSLEASGVNWIGGAAPAGPLRVGVRIRHQHRESPATVRATAPGRAHVAFDEPQRAVTPGQAVVFYDGDEVLGGGWID